MTISSDDENFEIKFKDENGSSQRVFTSKSFEKEFFSESTNELFCVTFLKNALRDPITNEIGKTIFFCVSIEHACKITQILNQLADTMFPGRYNSDFAVQITSNIPDSQQMTINFANNNLNGHTHFLEDYDSSKTRVAVTVAMMTTGYDCRDLLNVCFCRPVFSPSDFIQMKGRGTRIFDFKHDEFKFPKECFKLFDFFGVCEYFEEDFNYDEKIKLPPRKKSTGTTVGPVIPKTFKQIFKNATVPYRDPEVLTLFLKEIDALTYNDSEVLGDAYEYLLSILGSQGELGQFRTPRHIIDFMVDIVHPTKNDRILDPACGTAGFLISAYKFIINQKENSTLNYDEKKKILSNICG